MIIVSKVHGAPAGYTFPESRGRHFSVDLMAGGIEAAVGRAMAARRLA